MQVLQLSFFNGHVGFKFGSFFVGLFQCSLFLRRALLCCRQSRFLLPHFLRIALRFEFLLLLRFLKGSLSGISFFNSFLGSFLLGFQSSLRVLKFALVSFFDFCDILLAFRFHPFLAIELLLKVRHVVSDCLFVNFPLFGREFLFNIRFESLSLFLAQSFELERHRVILNLQHLALVFELLSLAKILEQLLNFILSQFRRLFAGVHLDFELLNSFEQLQEAFVLVF